MYAIFIVTIKCIIMQQYVDQFGYIKNYNPETTHVSLLIDELTKSVDTSHSIIQKKNGPWLDIWVIDNETQKHDGFYMIIYSNSLTCLRYFKQGENHGRIYSWTENGKRKSESIFINNCPHGYLTEWNEYGNIMELIRYDNGLCDGFNITYDKETDSIDYLSRFKQTV